MEQALFVIYDVGVDRVRKKFYETCRDYGLVPVQYSAFFGRLGRNRREELFARLARLLQDEPGNVIVSPICDADVARILAAGEVLGISQEPVVRLV
jgi:CRISPR-associated protein Cas2